MRFLVAWDGSELSTLALRATIRIFSRSGDQLLVYHVANRGRYGTSGDLRVEALEARLAPELEAAAGKLSVLAQMQDGNLAEVETSANGSEAGAPAQHVLTVHEKDAAEAAKISQRIVDFAEASCADALVMGSMGAKQEASASYQRTTLGSSAHLAALRAPCTVMLVRPGCKLDPQLSTVFMVAEDGSQHGYQALRLAADLARPKKDEIVCRVFGPPAFTDPIEETCRGLLQEVMREKGVEYAVIAQELEQSADDMGDELAEAARECRFRQQAFLVFGARGRRADNSEILSPSMSPMSSPNSAVTTCPCGTPTTLGHVARWCIREAQCSLIIARTRAPSAPAGVAGVRLQFHKPA